MNEEQKYRTIKKLVESGGNKTRAAIDLGVTKRHINRMIQGYIEKGKDFFLHGNRGRKPATTLSDELKQRVIDLYTFKYYDANFTHYTELLGKHEEIQLSISTVSSILEHEYILSPRVTKPKKKRLKKQLQEQKDKAKSKWEAATIEANLVAVEDAHSRIPRSLYFGEKLLMDASSFLWFSGAKTFLHLAVDDATGNILGGRFDQQETLNGYYHVFHQILTTYGIPYGFVTDRRTIFEYKSKKSPSLEEDTYTQFAYACKQLGVHLHTTSVAQAKSRVERMFESLQSRLPVELRLAGITELDDANVFLNSYIKEYNAKFALQAKCSKSVFEIQPEAKKINLYLAVLTERVVDSGHCLKYRNRYYRMLDERGYQVHYLKGTKAMLIEAFNGLKYCCVNDKSIYALEEVPQQYSKSKEMDHDYKEVTPKKQSIPDMNHPWRRKEFWKFVKTQEHHWDHDIPPAS